MCLLRTNGLNLDEFYESWEISTAPPSQITHLGSSFDLTSRILGLEVVQLMGQLTSSSLVLGR